MNLQESGEMYLESIYVLLKERANVRSIDVVEYMNFSKPSVSRAVGLLKNGGYITVGSDGFIALTDMGRDVAEKMYERHMLITKWLVSIGVPEDIAADDACKVEHVISEETFVAIKGLIK